MIPYQRFAKIYDELMDDSLYDQWQAYTVKYIPQNESVLELGCGSGRLASRLSEVGFQVTGLDNSSEMLTLAQIHKENTQTEFMLIERDMTDLSDLPTYDHVISFNDSICYLPNLDIIRQTFEEVYQHLNNGGVFLFDVHSTHKMKTFLTESFHAETEDGLLIWDSYPGEAPHSVEHDLSIFVKRSGSCYERFNETHKERTYPVELYLDQLKKVGFHSIELTSDFTDEWNEQGERWFFKAQK